MFTKHILNKNDKHTSLPNFSIVRKYLNGIQLITIILPPFTSGWDMIHSQKVG